MADKAWKQRERKAAALFGGERNSLSGGNGKISRADVIRKKENGDIENEFPLFVEIKLRKKHTAVTLYDDTAGKAKKERRVPVVVLAEKNRPGFWIMCKDKDIQLVAREMLLDKEVN